ncbi:hypothetical protein STAN_2287 [Streptomyces sp. CBMAI 2042]|nr:hypothetical protein STAN_2287 [Streptomyces sp. CBMAI 2042]
MALVVAGTAASRPLHGPVAPGQVPLPQAAVGSVAAALGQYARQHRQLDISMGALP